MKPLSHIFADVAMETLESLERLVNCLTRKPMPEPSLLALNIDWFTHCNWRDQLIAFKQIDSYRSYKH